MKALLVNGSSRKNGCTNAFYSSVCFAHPSGRLLTFMDRAFYSGVSDEMYCSWKRKWAGTPGQ